MKSKSGREIVGYVVREGKEPKKGRYDGAGVFEQWTSDRSEAEDWRGGDPGRLHEYAERRSGRVVPIVRFKRPRIPGSAQIVEWASRYEQAAAHAVTHRVERDIARADLTRMREQRDAIRSGAKGLATQRDAARGEARALENRLTSANARIKQLEEQVSKRGEESALLAMAFVDMKKARDGITAAIATANRFLALE